MKIKLDAFPIIENFEECRIENHFLQRNSKPVNLQNISWLQNKNSYYCQGISGTLACQFARSSVVLQLEKAIEVLGSEYKFLVYDAFRTKKTQIAIFDAMYDTIKRANPNLSHFELMEKTRVFVAHPDEISRFSIPPHNSGGAIDLTLLKNGIELDMGTHFDEPSPLSFTSFFEQAFDKSHGVSKDRWDRVRANRRILFNVLKSVGFVNYAEEWWHYDLGDCLWASQLQSDWHYESMEPEVSIL
jgi:zinc D-Ala-D-Ala dipeptidase